MRMFISNIYNYNFSKSVSNLEKKVQRRLKYQVYEVHLTNILNNKLFNKYRDKLIKDLFADGGYGVVSSGGKSVTRLAVFEYFSVKIYR